MPKSEVEIKGEIEPHLLAEARKKALKKFGDKLDLPGFRRGHIPEKVMIERISERELLEEAANILLNEYYPQIVSEKKIDAIGRPKVSVTKLAIENPLEFIITTAILPEFELPQYKKIAEGAQGASNKTQENIEVSEKEIEDVLLQIRKNNPGSFENLGQLKEKVKENIISEKKLRNLNKKRAAIIDAILAKTVVDLPEILIESEIEKSLAQMKDEINRVRNKLRREVGEPIGASAFEDYLKAVKKSEEEIREDLREGSEKKAKIQLIFNKIAEAEKLEPNKEILEHEVKQIMEHYPEANPENVRIYVSTQLINQEVLRLLER